MKRLEYHQFFSVSRQTKLVCNFNIRIYYIPHPKLARPYQTNKLYYKILHQVFGKEYMNIMLFRKNLFIFLVKIFKNFKLQELLLSLLNYFAGVEETF